MKEKNEIYLSSFSYRILLMNHLASVLIHPAYYIFLKLFDPGGVHQPVQRLITSVISSAGLIFHLYNIGTRSLRQVLIMIGTCSIMVHLYYLCHLNNLSPVYSIGTLLAHCLILFCILTPTLWRLYSILSILGSLTLIFSDKGLITDPMMFASTIIMTTLLFDRLKFDSYQNSIKLFYAYETQKTTAEVLQLSLKSKELKEILINTLKKVNELPFVHKSYPVKIQLGPNNIFEKKILSEFNNNINYNEELTEKKLPLGYGKDKYGFISFAIKEKTLGSDRSDEFLSTLTDAISLLIKANLDNMKIEEQTLLLSQSAKMVALGEMAGGIAHEINNPLTIISGYASNAKLVLKKDSLDKDRLDQIVSKIESTVSRIARIIKGLKSFSRDGQKDKSENVNIYEIIEESLGLCQERFKTNGVKLIAPIKDSDQQLIINCRRVQISQCLINLLNNAFDSVYDSKTLNPKVEISVQKIKDELYLKVIDNGPGVLPEVEKKLFEPFFTTKAAGKGTGLGLSLSLQILKDHKGDLTFSSTRELTEFVIILPILLEPTTSFKDVVG